MTAWNKMTTTRRIQICLFVIEFVAAVTICYGSTKLFKILPFGGISWTAELILLTLAGLWIIKSTLGAMHSLQHGSVYKNNEKYDIIDDDKNDPLIICHEREGRQAHSTTTNNAGEDKSSTQAQSEIIAETKKSLSNTEISSGGQDTADISFPIMAIFATVILQCAIRLFVLAQNLRRKFRFKKRVANDSLIQLTDIPFAIGKKMSSGGCSFFIFSFLNGWVRCDDNSQANGDNSGVSVDNNMTLQAVSFDQISINSSRILRRSPRQCDDPVDLTNSSIATTQPSWWGFAFGGIEMNFEIHLKKEHRRPGQNVRDDGDTNIRTITITIKVESLQFNILPRCLDWVNVRGIQIDTDATFDTDGSAPFDCSQTNSSGECKTLFGFGMSTAFSQLNMHLFSSKNTTTGLASGNDKRNEVLAWDGAKSSFYLRQFDSSSQNTGNKVLRKKTVASISYPAGFIVVHGSKQKQFETRLASTASPLRQAAIYVGKYANNRDDNSAMGDSSFILGVDLKVLSIFVQSTDVLLQNIAGSVVRDNSSARVHQNAMQIVSNKKTAKKTEKTDVVEFYFISCVHLYALLPTSKNNGTPPFCDNSHANATIMNTLSLRTTLASLQWRKRLQVKSSDESFDGDSFRGYLGIMPQKHYDVSSINLADVRDTSLRYEVFGIGQHDNECAAALSLAVLKRTKAKFIHLSCSENKSALPDNKIRDVVHKSKCMAVDLGSVAVRLNGEVVTHLACIMQTVDGAQVAVTGLQRTSKRIKQIVSNKGGKSSSPDSCVVKQNSFDRVDLSCSCVDAIIDLPIAPDGVNNSYSIECDDAANDQQVRMALLNGKTTVGISKFGGIVNVTPQTTYCGAPGFPDVDETFETELQKNAECYLFEIAISQIEGSVAFFPHASLPVIDRETTTIIAPRKKETIFYSHATGLLIKTTSPLNNSQTKNTPLQSPPPTTSKAIAVDFDDLSVYERFNEDDQTGSSLFSIPVSEFLLSRNGPGAPADWPMMQTYFENKNSLVKILKCKGKVCMVDRRDIVAGEKSSLVLIKFSESSSSELEIVWSPVFQWLQASCNYRVQEALARLKACLPKKQSNKSGFPCQKTNIRIGVDSLSRAHMHTFLGSRSAMQTVFEGGLDLSISMTKHVPPATTTSKESASKPNITFQAKHVLVLLNGIETPIFTFDSLFVENIIRRASDNEVMEFVRKSDQPIHDLGDFIVTDHDGHPLKEIFELKLGSCTTMKFPPVLHFGGVIDDFLLTPRALDIGLGSLKNSQHKRMKRYQMMSIKCIIPFLDVALMNPSPDAKHHSLIGSHSPPTSQSFLRDELRLCLEAVDVSIERNTPPEITQSQINALDEDDSSIFDFGPSIQGGEIYLTMNHVVCTLHPLNLATPLIRVNDLTVDGILYLAGLSPTTPEIQEGKTITSSLSCHHNFSTNARQCKCCCYGVSFHSTGIPVKLYSDCKVFCEDLDISYGPVLNPSIPRLMECLQRLLPPPPKTVNKQDPPPPISWWDNLRFFVHGPLSLSVNAMAIRWLLDSHTFRDQSIILNCQKCCIDYNLGYFEIDATDLNVSIPGTAYDMSCHPSKMDRTKKTVFLPYNAESMSGFGRHPLIYVPSFNTKISFQWKMLFPGSSDSSNHHSPYRVRQNKLVGDQCLTSDKFVLFRSDGATVKFEFELSGGDACANWVALRIDVLPWFTHLNSTATYPSQDGEKAEPFPPLRSIAIKVSVSELKVATWFAGEDEVDEWGMDELGGVCLILRRVNYSASVEGTKEIKIEGPVKAALLDLSDFKMESQTRSDEMLEIETLAAEFGAPNCDTTVNNIHDYCYDSEPSLADGKSPFLKLEVLSRDIDELDYLFITGQIDIQNKSLERILSGSDDVNPKAEDPNAMDCVGQGLAVVDKSTWSILVSRLKLLWTIEIRDALMVITQDLIFTVGFMKSQIRQSQVLAEKAACQEDPNIKRGRDRPVSFSGIVGDGVELSSQASPRDDGDLARSKLEYLLERDEGFEINIAHDGDHSIHTTHSENGNNLESVPTLDIHFSNPQVQLHSKTTGGSVILAMEGAHVEGRKFANLLVERGQNKSGKILPCDLIRKTEHAYTLTNMEAYALSTHIDINAGLPWLEVCMASDHHAEETVLLQERFDIDDIFSSPAPAMRNRAQMQNSLSNGGSTLSANTEETHHSTFHEHADEKQNHNYIYPLNLRHHEPLAFSKTGLLRPILDKFTFQSHQIFHRPPIHYSTEELISFINQGLVYQQDEVAVDHIELQIDLLHFKLDSYQFKTTIDLIRNVLLEPPKPYRRHLQREKFDHVESETTPKPSKRVSSVAATEMEETLKSKKFSNDYKHLGKKGREALRSSAMGLLRDLEDRLALSGDNINRRIAYTLSKLKWSIQCPDEIDDVEIAFTGFYGQHDYSTNGSVVSHFGLEDVRISSSKPGPDSICFLDPTSVVKSVLGDERSPCQRCGEKFDHNENNLNSCKFHQGTFKSGTWSCCKSTKSNSLGCKAGPHTGKERAATVRVEALPRSVDGITLYTHFEVNIFPSVPHTLVLQISKSMSRLFMNYFFVEDDGKDDLDTLSTVSEVKGSVETNSTQSESTPKQPFRKSLLIGGKGSLPAGGRHTREDLYQNRTSEFETPSELEVPDNLTEGAEIIFIKVWRVGYVNINISTGGFRRLPQTSLDICVPAYSKAYEVGTSAYLGHKFLTYLIKEVLKSGASSGLDKFRKKMMGGNYSSPNIDQGKSYVEERESPPTSIIRTDLSELGPNNDRDTYLRRHLHRPIGADAILGTPAKKVKQKKGLPFGKK